MVLGKNLVFLKISLKMLIFQALVKNKAAKVDTRQSAGLSVVAKPKRPENPSFSKAIWISRLNPNETSENIAEYISNR